MEERGLIKRWYVVADHPILSRQDKYGLTRSEAVKLANILDHLGYENIKMDIKTPQDKTKTT